MLKTLFSQISALDWLALSWFIFSWAGYAWFAEHGERAKHGLVGLGHKHRLEWARRLLEREIRIVDASLIGNLMSSVSFYANTTIYIIAGIFAVLGTLDKWATVAADLPFGHAASRDNSSSYSYSYLELSFSPISSSPGHYASSTYSQFSSAQHRLAAPTIQPSSVMRRKLPQ